MKHRHARPSHSTQRPRSTRCAGFTWLELLFVFCVIGLLIAVMLPYSRSARSVARRTQCESNLKQIAIALHNYQKEYQSLPPAYTVDADGQPLHSWRTLLLPYLDEKALYESIDLSKPWDDPTNATALNSIPAVFLCPSIDVPPNVTNYVAVVGSNACFLPHDSRPFAEITDDRAETLMVVEVSPDLAVPWMAPQDGGGEFLLSFNPDTNLPHEGGIQAAFADGHVEFLPAKLSAANRAGMITVDGNESIDEW